MPQLDLESVIRVGFGSGDSRSTVACETIALPGSDAGGQCNAADDAAPSAESSRIRIGGGVRWAWSELTGTVLERDGSTKGGSNPKATAAGTRKGAPRPRRLLVGKTAVSIGVLPAGKMAMQQRRSPVLGRGWRRQAAGARVFASEAVETEPASPKVSCFGAVRSESRAAAAAAAATAPHAHGEEQEGWSACWASVTAALHHLRRSNNDREVESDESKSKATAPESPTIAVLSPPSPVVGLGLGDVKRLASGRWPESLAGGQGRGPV